MQLILKMPFKVSIIIVMFGYDDKLMKCGIVAL